jgi:hypothetical protein
VKSAGVVELEKVRAVAVVLWIVTSPVTALVTRRPPVRLVSVLLRFKVVPAAALKRREFTVTAPCVNVPPATSTLAFVVKVDEYEASGRPVMAPARFTAAVVPSEVRAIGVPPSLAATWQELAVELTTY